MPDGPGSVGAAQDTFTLTGEMAAAVGAAGLPGAVTGRSTPVTRNLSDWVLVDHAPVELAVREWPLLLMLHPATALSSASEIAAVAWPPVPSTTMK